MGKAHTEETQAEQVLPYSHLGQNTSCTHGEFGTSGSLARLKDLHNLVPGKLGSGDATAALGSASDNSLAAVLMRPPNSNAQGCQEPSSLGGEGWRQGSGQSEPSFHKQALLLQPGLHCQSRREKKEFIGEMTDL